MRLFFFVALFLPAAFQATSQSAPTPLADLPKDPRAVLDLAAPLYDFNDPTLKPWHLKATYQLFDENGKPTEQGTYEYWWASPKVYRTSWMRPSAMSTSWAAPDGTIHQKETGGPLRYFERDVHAILLPFLPAPSVQDSGRMKLDLKTIGEGQSTLVCVTTVQQFEQNGVLKAPPSATPDYYCFEPATKALRLKYSHSITTEYNHIVKSQGRYLARQVDVLIGKQKEFSISIETIDGMDPSALALIPPEDSAVVHEPVREPDGKQSNNNVKFGSLVKKTPPYYPPMAKAAHEQGTVVLVATIGTDGKLHDLEVLASPSSLLRDSAIEAVKRWEYIPYLLNGQPVEVETTVNVIFTLGG
jgi:TonB family protein